jgi:hypothetical protein
MRHLVSVILSLVLAPLIYVAAGYAAVKLEIATHTTTIDWSAGGIGLTAALLAGGLYALLVMVRLSPVGPVLAGLAYLGITLWSMLDKAGFADAMPKRFLGEDRVLTAPVGAGTLLLTVPLLVTVFSPRRWRRTDAVGAVYEAPSYSSTVVSAAPSYADLPTTTYTPPLYTPSYGPSTSTTSPLVPPVRTESEP